MRAAAGDRAVLRAIHVFDENRRAAAEGGREKGIFRRFWRWVSASGASSWQYLQNVTSGDPAAGAGGDAGRAAVPWRTGCRPFHGGGFAGTALAFVPDDRREMFRRTVEQTLGGGQMSPFVRQEILLPTAADTVKIGSRKKRMGTIT